MEPLRRSAASVHSAYLALLELAKKNIGCLVKFEFGINNKFSFNISMSHIICELYLHFNSICYLCKVQIQLSILHFTWPLYPCSMKEWGRGSRYSLLLPTSKIHVGILCQSFLGINIYPLHNTSSHQNAGAPGRRSSSLERSICPPFSRQFYF